MVASLLFVALSGGAGIPAAAAESVVPSARLRVDAKPTCTTRTDVIARVRARSPRVRFDEQNGEIGIRAEFSVTQSGAVDGRVVLAGAGAQPSLRRVLAGSCSEAADAIALIIAVTLDPTAAQHGENGAAPESVTAVASPPPSEPPLPPLHGDNSDVPGARGRHTFGLQLAGQSIFGPAPEVMPGVALYAMVAVDRPASWSPAVLLGATHAWRSGIGAEGGTAAFKLSAASFDACPFRLQWGPVEARPCASVLIGRLAAVGSETSNPASEVRRPFWVAGGAVVASTDFLGMLEISARLAIGANLVRDSFEFTPFVFHQVPAMTTAASVGLGLRWR